jgi:CIC family chloride channel protein
MKRNISTSDDLVFKHLIKLSILSLIIAVFTALAGVLFVKGFMAVEKLFYGDMNPKFLVENTIHNFWWLLLIMPLGGLIVGLLTYYVMPGRVHAGLPGIIDSVHNKSGKIKLREGVGVGLISAVGIGIGASVGRFGPAIHIGATLGSWLATLIRVGKEERITLLASGTAAAIAASFNAPFAGVVFVHEAILKNYSIKAFAPVALASIVGFLIGKHFFPTNMFASIKMPEILNLNDYGIAVVIGVVSAVVAIVFLKSLMFSQSKIYPNMKVHKIIRPVIGGVILACLSLAIPHVIGLGGHVLNSAIVGNYGVLLLLAILVAKIASISVSFGTGFNGGLFAPAVFLGVITSSLVISLFTLAGVNVESITTMSLVGAGCVVSAIFGAPIATTIIILELANSYSVASVVLVGVVVTRLISFKVFGKSYFDFLLLKKGVDTRFSKKEEFLSAIKIQDFMNKDFVTIDSQSSLKEIKEKIIECDGKQELFVVADDKLIGLIRALYLVKASPDSNELAKDLMSPINFKLHSEDTTKHAFDKLSDFTGLGIPVVNNYDNIIGIVSESSIVDEYFIASDMAIKETSN